MKIIRLFLLTIFSITSIISIGQIPFEIKSNGFKSEITDYLETKKEYNKYDFFIIQSEYSFFWSSCVYFRLLCINGQNVCFVKINLDTKKHKYIVIDEKTIKYSRGEYILNSFDSIGTFNINNKELDCAKDDKVSVMICDGSDYVLEFWNRKNNWGVDFYEPFNNYEYCKNVNYLTFINSISLFDEIWNKKN